MDSCSRSIETINIVDLRVDSTADDVTRLYTRFPAAPAKDADNYEEYIDLTLNIRKTWKRGTFNCLEDHETVEWFRGLAAIDIMQVDIELNNFIHFAQSCSRAGIPQQNGSQNNTTKGWKTLTGTTQRMDKDRSQITSRLHQSPQRTNCTALDVEGQQHHKLITMDQQLLQQHLQWYRG
eukprot:3068574-Amphidinium_carterae.3